MHFSKDEISLLSKYLYSDFPLGPINASDIDDVDVKGLLFDSKNELYHQIIKRPSILIGRKGSGKTAFLQKLTDGKNYTISIEIKTSEAFVQIVRSIEDAIKQDGFIFTESVADFWDFLFWVAIMAKIKEIYPNHIESSSVIERVLSKFNITTNLSTQSVLRSVIDSISSRTKNMGIGVITDVIARELESEKTSLREIKQNVNAVLKANKSRAIIVLDSLDDYELDINVVTKTLSGLLMSVGRFNIVRGRPEIRLCLPSEIYHSFESISRNKIKDFSQSLILQWTAGELISLVMFRYSIYLNVYRDELNISNDISRSSCNIDESDEAKELFRLIFPGKVSNKANLQEGTMPYILRHTQLLPRQIIKIVNEIVKINTQAGHVDGVVRPCSVKKGVEAVEQGLWKEVCSAFKFIYPRAEEVVSKIVPELPLSFSDSTLSQVYVKHAKAALKDIDMDYHDFKRMLIEIGCIGVVIKESEKYIEGVFEYTMPDTLNPSTEDSLCLHPMFCGCIMPNGNLEKVVYPYGAELDSNDYRDL
ncbi:MAG: hypothetical protein methR_P3002 [Methyloprofundus sp.]|nr:MAG: hypothetical protein methR_P3002 [Methyloprofundus sp.]